MDTRLDLITGLWPIFVGFITLVVVLAKMHSDLETVKEKIRVLFDLFALAGFGWALWMTIDIWRKRQNAPSA